ADMAKEDVSHQEYTRQVDLAFIEDLARSSDADTLSDFLLATEAQFRPYEKGETHDAVRLTTYHQAKGLEWEAVFLPSLYEGEIPDRRAKGADELAEERRLFYVGITREKRVLELSTGSAKRPSRFLEE